MNAKIPKKIKNRYFALRHGESKPNVAEIIISHPEHGAYEEFTLTQKGEEQVRNSIEQAKSDCLLDKETIIYSSPFSRCKRTAEIAKEVLGVKDEIRFDERLRERWFGDFEKTHRSNYQKVWEIDTKDAASKDFNIESAQEVQNRTIYFMNDLENMYFNKRILLVSHGDVLHALQTKFSDKSPNEQKQSPYLNNAEIRELI